jgi:carboxyl-terminal processing protease
MTPTAPIVTTSRARGLLLSVTLLLSLGLAACGKDPKPATIEWTGPLFEHGALNQALVGAWRAPGRGYLLEVTPAGYTAFVETASLCYQDPQGGLLEENLPAESLLRGTASGKSETVRVLLLGELPARFTLQRIAAIPAPCREPVSTTPDVVFRAFWEIFDLDYAFFSERGIDWKARLAPGGAAVALATSDAELFAVLAGALQGFNDAHTNLFATTGAPLAFNAGGESPTLTAMGAAFQAQTALPDFGAFVAAWTQSLDQQVAARLTGGSGPVLNGLVTWGRLPGNVGYLRVTAMDAYTGAGVPGSQALANMALIGAEVDRALAQLADTRAMILDVAHNGGGEDAVSWEIAGRFTDRKRLAFTARFHRPQGMGDDVWTIEPRGPKQYLKPVYLLTSDLTASAAEGFTLMMRALPNVVHSGQSTQGVFSEVVPKHLPGGRFAVTLSTERIVDAAGQLFEGRGIPPTLPVPLFDPAAPETLLTGHAAAIDQLLRIIGP